MKISLQLTIKVKERNQYLSRVFNEGDLFSGYFCYSCLLDLVSTTHLWSFFSWSFLRSSSVLDSGLPYYRWVLVYWLSEVWNTQKPRRVEGHIVREKMEKWWFWIQFYIVLLWWQKYSEISLLKNYQTTDKIILDSGKLSLLSVDIVKRCLKPWVTSYTTSPSCIQILVMRKRRIAMKLCRHASTE